MNLKTDQITKVIQDQIKSYGVKTKQDEIGYVIQVGDGIAKVHGLDRCWAVPLMARAPSTAVRPAPLSTRRRALSRENL